MRSLRSLVLGGSGMLGGQVVAEGRRRGHPTLGLSRVAADVTELEGLLAWGREFRPEVVFNCAAMTAVDACEGEEERAFAINAGGAANAAALARAAGARLFQLSTDYVFDGSAREPYPEDAPTGPRSAYGRSKLAGEAAALAGGEARDGAGGGAAAGSTIVRTSWLFGPGGPSFVATMLRLMAEGTAPLRVVDDQVGCPTYTPYLARALWDLAEIGPAGGAAGVVHYCNREPVSWYGFACEIAASRRPAVAVEPISTAESARSAPRPAYSVLAVERFERLTGRPVESWRAGLGHYLDTVRGVRNA